jgi:hypothetical protein
MASLRFAKRLLLGFSTFLTLPCVIQGQAIKADQEALLALEQQIYSADARHDIEATSGYFDDAYLIKSVEGRVYDKSSALKSMQMDAEQERKTATKQSPAKIENAQSSVLENSGLVVYRLSIDAGNQTMSCDMTDTFIRRSGTWKLASRVANCH